MRVWRMGVLGGDEWAFWWGWMRWMSDEEMIGIEGMMKRCLEVKAEDE